MKKVFFLSLFIFASVVTFSAETWFSGTWEGKGVQIDGATWGIQVIATDPNNIKVNYADLKCGGFWSHKGSKGKKLFFTEHIEEGTEFCDQGAHVTVLQKSATEVKVTFVLKSYHKSKPIATAQLTKVG